MSKGLTDIAIRNLKPQAKRYEMPDPGAAGLYVVVQPSGKKSFAVRFRYAGQPRKLTLPGGLSLKGARKLASDALYEVEQGRDPSNAKKEAKKKAVRAKAETVQAVCEKYLKRDGVKLRTYDERKRTFERLIFPEIGDVQIRALKRSDIVRLLDGIQDNHGDRMADITLAYLRKALNWYESRDDEFVSPVVKAMGRYDAQANQGTRVLNDDEIRKIWAATEPNGEPQKPFHGLVRFLLLTCARRNEAVKMTRAEINGTDWELPAARNKVKVDLVRPLSKAAQRVLESLPVINGGPYVFTTDGETSISVGKPMPKLHETCGVDGWSLHDLRRTSRTLLSRAGISSDIAERCLGHALDGVREIYDKHKYHAEMQHAYEALAAQIDRIVNPVDNVRPMRRNG